jgi:hypothetical protein
LGERLALREKRRKCFKKMKARLGLAHTAAEELPSNAREYEE